MEYIPIAKPEITEADRKLVDIVLESGWVSSAGAYISFFEKEFAQYCGRKYAVAVANGTVALHLALLSLDLLIHDEIFVPNLTFIATANVVKYLSNTPNLIDINPETWNVSLNEIKRKIRANTKVIIPVHLFGLPCDMEALMDITKNLDIHIVEDCAEAHGATINGRKVGSFGDISCFSFFGNKIITTGEGGMCLTDDEKLYEKMLVLRDHGMSRTRKYWHEVVGYNYRMTNMQAALGCSQLNRIDQYLIARRKNGQIYREFLKESPYITLPVDDVGHAYWVFPILVDGERDKIIERFEQKKIETRPFFYPLTSLPPYLNHGFCPVSEEISARGIMLPCYPSLKPEQIEYICETLLDYWKDE